MNSRIIPAISVIIAIAIFFIYVNPMWTGSIANAKAAIAVDDQDLVSINQYIAQQNTLASERDAIDPALLSSLSTFLPGSVDNVGLILDLNALAARSKLSVGNIDVVANSQSAGSSAAVGTADTNPVGSVDLSLSAVGTFDDLQTFLSGVEKSERLLDVRDLSVTGSDTGVYNYKMTLRLYWLR
jgi:Tfp pilus assembly protein PilO